MNQASPPANSSSGLKRAAQIIVVSSVMFSFISYWRTAAVVLCDLGSTAYYIGGIVEQAVGASAPWFILAVMVFSYAVRSVYIESCSLFIRGGVYRVVKEALGRFFAKLAVSALIFDYLLTGPISGVSAGHYLMGLMLDSLRIINQAWAIPDEALRANVKAWGAVFFAIAVTLYFYRLNIRGIHESSDRALKIMVATTVMVVIILAWCGVTLAVQGIAYDAVTKKQNELPFLPNLSPKPKLDENTGKPKLDENTGQPEMQPDPIGFLAGTTIGEQLRPDHIDWFSLIGAVGIMIAFGHSILAMSGEETLAQVYREVEAPKLQNFRRAAFIVFVYSLVFTAGISFLAIMLIPETKRVTEYSENLISGLAMNMIGPDWLKLCLNAFVVIVGFLILSGAVNTAIIGSNGVLNRVAEDGVMPEWFLKPHAHYGTSHRMLTLIVALQVAIILITQGDVLLLGEAYAFGVVWSFVFQALAMVVLRFKDPRPREYKVPFNLTVGGVEIPFGLLAVLLILLTAALLNLCTKQLATIFGSAFTAVFFTLFLVSEYYHDRRLKGAHYKHLEQFNQDAEEKITTEGLGLTRPFRKLVAIRSTQNLFMLEKALADTDPTTTDVVVMTAKTLMGGESAPDQSQLDSYDQELMTAVVQRAEMAGKPVFSLIVPTNNPVYALMRTAKDLKVQELVIGASNKFTADDQLDQISLLWYNLNDGYAAPLTVRILSKDRDLHFDIGGGNRIPRAGESKARTIAELRRAGVGADRVLLVQRDSRMGLDVFQSVFTTLDPEVELKVLVMPLEEDTASADVAHAIEEQSKQVGRKVAIHTLNGKPGEEIIRQAKDGGFDLIIVPLPDEIDRTKALALPDWIQFVLQNAPSRVLLVVNPVLPTDLAE
jgi:amino acid transporter/nucleotide-binding universal stress UspA family protein